MATQDVMFFYFAKGERDPRVVVFKGASKEQIKAIADNLALNEAKTNGARTVQAVPAEAGEQWIYGGWYCPEPIYVAEVK